MGSTIGNALAATVIGSDLRSHWYFLQPVIGVGLETKDNKIPARSVKSLDPRVPRGGKDVYMSDKVLRILFRTRNNIV